MMIATGKDTSGELFLLLGITSRNVTLLQSGKPIMHRAEQHGGILTCSFAIVYGENEQELEKIMRGSGMLAQDARVYIDTRDGGELMDAITADRVARRVCVDFASKVNWLSMTPEQAMEFAAHLQQKATIVMGERL